MKIGPVTISDYLSEFLGFVVRFIIYLFDDEFWRLMQGYIAKY